jgi:hypothetical protein
MVVTVVIVVVMVVVMVVAALVVPEALPPGGVHRHLRGPLAIEAILGPAGGPDTEKAPKSETAPGGTPARGAADHFGDGSRGEDLVHRGTAVTAVVDERHARLSPSRGRAIPAVRP